MTKGVGILLTRTELGEEERKKEEDNNDTDDEEEKDSVCSLARTVKRSIDVCGFLVCFCFVFPFWVMLLNKSHKTHHPKGNRHPVLTRQLYLGYSQRPCGQAVPGKGT